MDHKHIFRIKMAAFVLTFFSLLVVKTTSSQEATGATKTYYSGLLKNLDKLKQIDLTTQKSQYQNQLTQAENALKNIKKTSPTFNVSKEEAELNSYKKALENQEGEKSLGKDLEMLMASLEEMKKKQPMNREGTPEHLANLAAGDTEYQLSVFKKRNPSYDCSPFEKEISDFKKAFASGVARLREGNNSNLELESKVKKIFKPTSVSAIAVYSEADILKSNQDVSDYKNSIDKLISEGAIDKIALLSSTSDSGNALHKKGEKPSAPRSLSNSWVIELKAELTANATSVDKDIEALKSMMKKSLDIEAIQTYNWIYKNSYYWYAAKELFSDSGLFLNVYQKYQLLVKEIGTLADYRTMLSANHKEFTKTVKMPASVKTDLDLEQKFKTEFAVVLSSIDKYKDETIVKVNIIENDWGIYRNELTGVILKRGISASIATKKEDGRYFVYDYVHFFQDYDGSNYLSGYVTKDCAWPKQILIENIK